MGGMYSLAKLRFFLYIFEKEYSKDRSDVLNAGNIWLSGGQVMKTKLVAIEGIGEDEGGFLVAAWEVGLKKDLI